MSWRVGQGKMAAEYLKAVHNDVHHDVINDWNI